MCGSQPLTCVSLTSDCCPFNATCNPFSVSQLLCETGRRQKPGHLWAGAARRQRGPGSFFPPCVRAGPRPSRSTRGGSGGAERHQGRVPRRGGAEENRPVPSSCGGARRETLAAKTAGTWVCEGVRGDRGRAFGGAKPARTRTLGPGLTCSARQALGQSASEPGLAPCRAKGRA